MVWEGRLFFRPTAAAAAVPVHEKLAGEPELRVDVYKPLSARAGLKLRGNGGWELKLRVEVDGARGFEKWKKHRCEDEAAAVAKAGEAATSAPEVSIEKQRIRASWVANALVEQTELRVTCGGATEVWRTVAAEGKRGVCSPLLQQLAPLCAAQAVDGVTSCGYPQFVCDVAARLRDGGAGGAAVT